VADRLSPLFPKARRKKKFQLEIAFSSWSHRPGKSAFSFFGHVIHGLKATKTRNCMFFPVDDNNKEKGSFLIMTEQSYSKKKQKTIF